MLIVQKRKGDSGLRLPDDRVMLKKTDEKAYGLLNKSLFGLLIGLLLMFFFKADCYASLQSWNDGSNSKVISVIYDNSTSMVSELGPDSIHTTRWVEASYAVSALAAMMNEGDILKIYPICPENSSELEKYAAKEIRIGEGEELDNNLKEVDEIVAGMRWEGSTPFSSVKKAAEDMRKDYDSEKDHWLVILTDGELKYKDYGYGSLADALEGINEDTDKPIYIAYIYVSGGNNAEEEPIETDNYLIFTPDEDIGNDITTKMTNIANKIYKRVAIKSSDQYIFPMGGGVEVDLNIPLEKVLIFTQYIGQEEIYKSIGNDNENENDMESIMEKRYSAIKVDGGIEWNGRLEEEFCYELKGRTDEITKSDFHTNQGDMPDIEKMKYCFIKGKMHVLYTDSLYQDFKTQKALVADFSQSSKQHSMDVYYKPAVTVDASFYQEGEPITHFQECLDKKADDGIERCIQAGELNIKIDILGNNENKDPVEEYELLYPDDFQVSLTRVEEEGETEENLDEIGTLEYACELEKGTYKLQVITSWNEKYEQTLEIQDRWKPISLELYNTDRVLLETEKKAGEISGADSDLFFRFVSEEELEEEDLKHVMDVICSCDSEYFEVEKVGKIQDGLCRFRVRLKNVDAHNVGEEIALHTIVKTDYMVDGSMERIQDFTLPVFSEDFQLSAQVEDRSMTGSFRRLFLGETAAVTYFCDGKELSEEQREDLTVEISSLLPAKLQKKTEIDQRGNIRLKANPPYWMFYQDDKLKMTLLLNYTRWNNEQTQEVEAVVVISGLSQNIRYMIIGIVVFVLIWGMLCFLKRFRKCFIKKQKPFLEMSVGNRRDVKLKRTGMIFNPFWNTVRVFFKDPSGRELYPKFHLILERNRAGKGFVIINYTDVSDGEKYQVGNKEINRNNRVIDDSVRFRIKNKYGKWVNLMLKSQ